MAIDRIGKGGAAPPVAPNEGPVSVGRSERSERPERPERTFEASLERAAAAPEVQRVSPVAPTPLERLRAGEIDVDRYVDLKVEQATSHLSGLRPHDLDAIRAALRVQVASDPVLADLVQQATGRAPTVPE
jgi:hypothetical protein